MPKLNSARRGSAETSINRMAKAMMLCFNFFKINFFLEGVEINSPIENPLHIAQAYVPVVQADDGHGKIE